MKIPLCVFVSCESATKTFIDNRLYIYARMLLHGYIFYYSNKYSYIFHGFENFSTSVVTFYHGGHFYRLGKRHILSIIAQRRRKKMAPGLRISRDKLFAGLRQRVAPLSDIKLLLHCNQITMDSCCRDTITTP